MDGAVTQNFISCVLGSMGIAFIMAFTHGPFGLCEMLRDAVEGIDLRWKLPKWVTIGVQCPICIGFWTSIPVAWYTDCGVTGWLSAVGAISAMVWIKMES